MNCCFRGRGRPGIVVIILACFMAAMTYMGDHGKVKIKVN
jgi:hypothetical protein